MVELLTISETAERMHVSRQTIYTWIHEGKLKPVMTPGGRKRIPEDQLILGELESIDKPVLDLFPIRDISELDPIRIEQMGTKEKYWFSRTEKHWYWDSIGKEFIFKAGREGTGENWAEKVAAALCDLLNLPHAEYDLATYRNIKGVISPNFVPNGSWLRHGNEILTSYVHGYEKTKRYRQTLHTIRIVLSVVTNKRIQLPIGWSNPGTFSCAADVFVGYLMLDAWIANQDRHHENWGLIFISEDKSIHLAPTFDHAASLARSETDRKREERITTKDSGMKMDTFVKKAKSAFYQKPGDLQPLSTLDAFYEAATRRPQAAAFWLNKLERVSATEITPILNRVPENQMSNITKKFTNVILELNRQRLLEMKSLILKKE